MWNAMRTLVWIVVAANSLLLLTLALAEHNRCRFELPRGVGVETLVNRESADGTGEQGLQLALDDHGAPMLSRPAAFGARSGSYVLLGEPPRALVVEHATLSEVDDRGRRALVDLPSPGAAITPGCGTGRFYVFGGTEPATRSNVYAYEYDRAGRGRITRLVELVGPASAVAGDADSTTYIAIGRSIFASMPNQPLERLLDDAGGQIRGLAVGPHSSLFFATDTGVGMVWSQGRSVGLMQADNPQIVCGGDELFVFVPRHSVFRVRPLARLVPGTEGPRTTAALP
jgi:hypothetical protein